jgi:hypothetical protein
VYAVWTHHSVHEGPPRARSLNVHLPHCEASSGSLSPIITLSVSRVSATPSYSSVPTPQQSVHSANRPNPSS